jgi:hypothetical protein
MLLLLVLVLQAETWRVLVSRVQCGAPKQMILGLSCVGSQCTAAHASFHKPDEERDEDVDGIDADDYN